MRRVERKAKKRAEAEARQAAYDALSDDEKLARVRARKSASHITPSNEERKILAAR